MLTIVRVVHLLSAAVWVGGTAALVFAGVPAIRKLEGEARALALRTLGRRWRPLGWGAMGVSILSGLWLAELHGALARGALGTAFDRTLIAKSAVVVALCIGAAIHDFVLGPRLQREMRDSSPQAPRTRQRLIAVGWLTFVLTIAVPVLGVVALGYVD